MLRFSILALAATALSFSALGQEVFEEELLPNGEYTVPHYDVTNENANARPMPSQAVLDAFNGREGVQRVVDSFITGVQEDPRTVNIFRASDMVRFRRTFGEQLLYILGDEGTDYTGRDMASAHADHGINTREFNAVVEILQDAMTEEGVPFRMQNKLVARLAPMKRMIVTR